MVVRMVTTPAGVLSVVEVVAFGLELPCVVADELESLPFPQPDKAKEATSSKVKASEIVRSSW